MENNYLINENSDKKKTFITFLITTILYGNLFCGWSFQNLKLGSLPINEIVLVILILSLGLKEIIKEISKITNIAIFVIWLFIGLIYLILGYFEYGLIAIRKGSHTIDAFYIFLGFYLISNKKLYLDFFDNFRIIIYILVVYILLIPFKETISNLVPNISGLQDSNTISLFNYTSISVVLLWIGFYVFINFKNIKVLNLNNNFIAFLFIFISAVIFQQRYIYLSLFIILILLIFLNEVDLKKIFIGIFYFIIISSALSFFDFNIEGRLSTFSLKFLINHILSTFGIYNEVTAASSGTVDQRIIWIKEVLNNSLLSYERFLFGIGYGKNLIEFAIGKSVIATEPHNAFLSLYGKMGIVGFSLWSVAHLFFIRTWKKTYVFLKEKKLNDKKNKILGLFIFIIIILVSSVTNSMFDETYRAIIYYIIWGIILRMSYDVEVEYKINIKS
jgi:hypothetical protein